MKLLRFLMGFGALWASVSSLRAVIVYGGDGSQNTTAPANGSPWDHVGTVGGGTGIYLGNYGGSDWVITANHIGAGNFTLSGTTYNVVPGSGVQIGGADLLVYRISSAPSLSTLALSATAPATNSNVTMIGAGRDRSTSTTTYYVDVNTDPWTWSTTVFGGADATADAYTWSGGTTMRWGTNTIAGTTTYNSTQLLTTAFDAVTGEAQGATGDSGGAMFYQNGSTWELAGVMAYIAGFSGQPGSTAIPGNETYSVNIANYRTDILNVIAIPEPADVALWCGAAGVVAMMIRRRAGRGRD